MVKFNSYCVVLICFCKTTFSCVNLIGWATEDDVEEISVKLIELIRSWFVFSPVGDDMFIEKR